jgi:hypothetical protein
MRYIICVIDDGHASASEAEMAAIGEFNEELRAIDQLVLAEGMQSGPNAWVIDNRDNRAQVSHGSHHLDPERYTGLWIIEAEGDAEARTIAQRASLACNRKVELRRFLR